ncbi:MAG: alpha/beta fold hydrolase [Chitinophagaceae bacterium]
MLYLLKPLLPFLLLLATATGFSQQNQYVGDWQGKLELGPGLRIVFHIREAGGKLSATADSPDQGARGLKCDTVYVNNDGLHVELRSARAAFVGKLVNDSVIEGTFTQGMPVQLILTRGSGNSSSKRPQDPISPLPYRAEELVFSSPATTLKYGATLTIPPGKGPFPAVVLITGSGQQNRDEEMMGHRPFAVLADGLTRNGIIVMRVDDRGIGGSTGDFTKSTSEDFAADVSACVDYLAKRPEVKKSAIGLIGHSEGGMIAPIVASKRKDLGFVVLLAAPGIPISQLMAEQTAAILRSSGVGDSAVKAYIPFYNQFMKTLTSGEDSLAAVTGARQYMDNWASVTDSSVLRQLQLNSPMARLQMLNTLVSVGRNPWFRYFMAFEPGPYLSKMKMKVLALNGDRDIQVVAESNMKGIRDAFAAGGNKGTTTLILPGLNHLFQTCTKCTVPEYGELQETFSPIAMKEINEWINRNVK